MYDNFVKEHFTVSPEDVLWFRNFGNLRSVQGLEHFHVLIRIHGNIDDVLHATRN